MFTSQERISAFKSLLGDYPKAKGDELLWPCRFCQQDGKDTHGDNFSFNVSKNAWNCVAVTDHGRQMSGLLRGLLEQSNPTFKTRKMKPAEYVQPSQMPQEILDYWEDRKITIKAFEHFNVKYDKANISMDFPTNTFQDKKKVLFHEEKNRSNYKQKKIGNNTVYPVNNKYEGQKKFLYLEGEPDLWCMYSNFPESFFKEYYVATTLHGASHIPALWKDKKYWENYNEVYLIGDADEAGRKAIKELQNIIGPKAKNINLPFKHQRLVNGIEVFHTSKDFNDWIIEGGNYEQFLLLLNQGSSDSLEIDKAVEEIINHPNKLQLLIDDVHKLGVVEEDTIIALVFLSFLSHKMDSCIGFVLKGRFSSGKSVIVKTVASLFPEESVLSLTSFSKLALQYMFDLSHKIIIQTEEHPANDPDYWEIDSQFRQLISEGEISRAIVEKDPATNKMVTNIYKVTGPIAYGSTTTQAAINEENESRLLALQTNDTAIHITKVKDMLDRLSMGKVTSRDDKNLIIRKWQKYINQLPKSNMRDIVIPFADQLEMHVYGPDMIRDYDKLHKLIKILAYFETNGGKLAELADPGGKLAEPDTSHKIAGITPIEGQFYKVSKRYPPIIFADLKHYKSIYNLTKDFFNSKATRINQNTFRNYERIRSACRSLTFTVKRVAEILILSRRRAQDFIREWESENMIITLEEKGERGAYQYKINDDWEVIDAELTLPEHIDKVIGVNGKVIEDPNTPIQETTPTADKLQPQESQVPQEYVIDINIEEDDKDDN